MLELDGKHDTARQSELGEELNRRDKYHRFSKIPILLYGVLLSTIGITMYLVGVLMIFPRLFFGLNATLRAVSGWIVWYSGIPTVAGIIFILGDLLILLNLKRPNIPVQFKDMPNRRVTVALTAYNDEGSIADAVRDFLAHSLVNRVIVVSNNSTDATFERASAAGAVTINELAPGYGRCVFRCLSEAIRYDDTDLIVLCEGDLTFRAYDIEKLIAYAPHSDVVNGTRTVEPLRQYLTQLTTFMYYGNVFVGKLLEAKHLGRGTITDVGTTYKLCWREPLTRLLPMLDPSVNLEFNAHFLDTLLGEGFTLVECPITFHPRVGVSKGGNVNNLRGLQVGMRMIFGIVWGWRRLGTT
ncbi:glycosyltransferase [Novosphingobium sp.]|uniref:glycosyltransferase n=1 Tax=Novosphingobium sp. TaxID=1874826 RepID=UPI003B52B66E